MLLFDYLENMGRIGITRKHIAYRIGITAPNLIKISYGHSIPSLLVAFRIVEYTRGEVGYNDLLEPYLRKYEHEYNTLDGIVRTGINPKDSTKKRKETNEINHLIKPRKKRTMDNE
jgi:transcriptional regulator with XRE-family HTH domain